jgi:hypothetical protein
MPKTMDDVVAEAEIKDIHMRYCRANDRMDPDLMRGCFHPDATIELHEPLTVDSFVALGGQMLGQYSVTWHNTGNQRVEVRGERAWAEHYTISSHRIPASADGPERDFIVHGRYVDRLEKRDGEWRIARRKLIVDYARQDPVGELPPGFGTPGGVRDKSDPSYTMWGQD